MDERQAYAEYRAGRITRAEWARVMLAEVSAQERSYREAGRCGVCGLASCTLEC